MRDIWIVVGIIVLAVVVMGIISCAWEYIEITYKHAKTGNTPENSVTIGLQYRGTTIIGKTKIIVEDVKEEK